MKAVLCLFLMAGVSYSHAEETVGEKVSSTAKDAKRGLKKGANRVQEAVCMKSDAKCLAQKAGNRMEEGGSTVKDKAVDVKESVDGK